MRGDPCGAVHGEVARMRLVGAVARVARHQPVQGLLARDRGGWCRAGGGNQRCRHGAQQTAA